MIEFASSPMSLRVRTAALLLFGLAVLPMQLFAASETWNGSSYNNWSTASDWSPSSSYPDNGHGASDYVAVITAGYVYQNIAIGASGPGVTLDALSLSGGSLELDNPLTVTTGSSVFSGGSIVAVTSGTSQLNISAGAIFNDNGNGQLSGGGPTSVINNSGVFENVGTLGDSPSISGWTLNNSGTLQTGAGTLTVSGPLIDTGIVSVGSASTLALAGGATASGTFNISSGGTLSFQGGTYNLAGATMNNGGSITFPSNTTQFTGTTASLLAGNVNINGGNLQINNSTTLGAVFTLGANGSGNGSITTSAGVTSSFNNLTWTGGTILGSGTLAVPAGQTMNLISGNKYIGTQGVLQINGTAAFSGGGIINDGSYVSGIINVGAGGLLDDQGSYNFYDNSGLGGIINNAGTFQKSGALGTSANISGWTINNSGTLQTVVGTLTISSTLNNTGVVNIANLTTLALSGGGQTGGTFNLSSGGTLSYQGGTYNLAGATMNNSGSITFPSNTTQFTGTTASLLAGNVNINGGNLQINNSTTLGAVFTLGANGSGNGSITTSAGVTSSFNNLTWTGGTILGSGTLAVPAGQTMNLSSGNKYLGTQGVLQINGTAAFSGGGIINDGSYVSGIINVGAGGLFDDQGSYNFYDNSGLGGIINNAGTFQKSGALGTSANISGWTINNSGTLQTVVGTLTISSTLNNSGVVNIANITTLALAGGGQTGGTFNISSGGTLSYQGGTYNLAGATMNNSGSITFPSNTTQFTGTTASLLAGNVNINGGTLQINNSTTLGADFTLGANGSGNGSITTSAGVTSSFNNLTWTGGTILGSGTLAVPAGQTMNLSGGNMFLGTQGILQINGTAAFNGGTVVNIGGYVSGIINVGAGGLFDDRGSYNFVDESGLGGIINNAGIFQKSGALGTSANISGWTINNSGTLQTVAGTLTISSTLNNTGVVNVANLTTLALSGGGQTGGTFNISSGGTLAYQGGTYNLAGATMNNSGSITFPSNTTQFTGTTASLLAGNVNINGGTLQINNSTTLGAAFTLGANGNGNGSITTSAGVTSSFNNLTWTGGTILGSGTLAVPAGQTMNLSGGNKFIGTQGVLQINGTAALSGGTVVNNGSYVSGVINIGPGGLFDDQGSYNFIDESGLGGIINNAGTFQKSGAAGTTSSISNWTISNTGTLSVKAGLLALTGTLNNSGNVMVSSSSTLSLAGGFVQTGGTTSVSGSISSTIQMAIQGGAVQGTGVISSALQENGTIEPGSSTATGTLTFDGNLSLSSSSQFLFKLGPSSDDFVVVNGTAPLTLNGALSLSMLPGYIPGASPLTLLFSSDNLSGAFSNVSNGGRLQTLDGTESFQVNYGSDYISISNAQAAPEPSVGLTLLGFFLVFTPTWLRRRSRMR